MQEDYHISNNTLVDEKVSKKTKSLKKGAVNIFFILLIAISVILTGIMISAMIIEILNNEMTLFMKISKGMMIVFFGLLGMIIVPFLTMKGLKKYNSNNYKHTNFALDLSIFLSFQGLQAAINVLALITTVIYMMLVKGNNLFFLNNKVELSQSNIELAEIKMELFNISIAQTAFLQILVIAGIILLLFKDQYWKQLKSFFKSPTVVVENLVKIIVYFVIAVMAQVFFTYIAGVLFPTVTTEANQEVLETMLNIDPSSIGFLIMIVISGPFIEEFFFRFLLIERILYKLPKIVIIITGTFFFAFMHAIAAETIVGFGHDLISYSGMSLILCVVYVRERNVFSTMGIHILNNFLAYGAMFGAAIK